MVLIGSSLPLSCIVNNPKQLIFPFQINQKASFESFFCTPENELLLSKLTEAVSSHSHQELMINGMPAAGKSFILQAICNELSRAGKEFVFVPMSKAIELSPEIFQNLSSLDSVCIDDLHLILSKKDWEVATFNLINECNQTGCNIFFSYGGGRELDEMIMLPDLLSRLKRMEFMTLHAVKDELLDSAINFICTQLDINLDKPELEFLMKRHKRELSSILSDLILLDQNAASLKRKITIPFIKETLDL